AIEANDGNHLPLYQKALCGLTAGAIGACFGSPADLALIRMQADATLPAAQRRHYTNAFHALYRIVADEGVLSLWKGASSVSGFFAAACSLPFDYVKTQIQKIQPDAKGKYPYTGSVDCAMKTLKAGGPCQDRASCHGNLRPALCLSLPWCACVATPRLTMTQKEKKTFLFMLKSVACVLIDQGSDFLLCACADDLDIPEPNSEAREKSRTLMFCKII
ncbi:hypothetical protein RJ640_022443, partial [Escallonia rubra]